MGNSWPQPISSLSRREFLRLAGVFGAAAALSACRPSETDRNWKIRLVYQDGRDEWYLPVIEEQLAQFHATHPHIQVFYAPEPASSHGKEEQMLAEMQAGTAPDVFQGCCSWFPIWAQEGYTLDLRPFVEADLDRETIEEWDAAQYRAMFTPDGRQYGLPKYHGALALYYNKDLFDQYGVTYPDASWTYEDYHQAMQLLTHDTGGDGAADLWGSQTYISWDRLQVHVNAWGGNLVDPDDPAKTRIAEPESLRAHEWLWDRMWGDRVMAPPLAVKNSFPDEVFASGKIAMLEDGSWRLKPILSNANFRVGVAPFPAGPVRRVTLGTTDGFGIYAGTRHPEAAWELVKFLTGKEFGRALARAGLLQPARASLVDEWAGFVREAFPEKTRDMDIPAFADGHRNGYSVVAEVADHMAEVTRITGAAWDQIFSLGREPGPILNDAARQIHALRQDAEAAEAAEAAD